MKLFEPGRIGKLSLKNRLVMAPMATRLTEPDGRLSQRGIDYHVARARGGVSLIITGSVHVNRDIEQPSAVKPHAHHFLIDSRMMADDEVIQEVVSARNYGRCSGYESGKEVMSRC